jgi:hypothetical protein
MTLSVCTCLHTFCRPCSDILSQYPGHEFVFTDGCLTNGSVVHAVMAVEQVFTYQWHLYNLVFTVEHVLI